MKLFTIVIGTYVKTYAVMNDLEMLVKHSQFVRHDLFEREELLFDPAIHQYLKLAHKKYEAAYGGFDQIDFISFVSNNLNLTEDFIRTCIAEKLTVFKRSGKKTDTTYLLTAPSHKVTMI